MASLSRFLALAPLPKMSTSRFAIVSVSVSPETLHSILPGITTERRSRIRCKQVSCHSSALCAFTYSHRNE